MNITFCFPFFTPCLRILPEAFLDCFFALKKHELAFYSSDIGVATAQERQHRFQLRSNLPAHKMINLVKYHLSLTWQHIAVVATVYLMSVVYYRLSLHPLTRGKDEF